MPGGGTPPFGLSFIHGLTGLRPGHSKGQQISIWL
jgi:hypothetical protein